MHKIKSIPEQPQNLCVLYFTEDDKHMNDWEGRGETQRHKIGTTAKKQCNPPLT